MNSSNLPISMPNEAYAPNDLDALGCEDRFPPLRLDNHSKIGATSKGKNDVAKPSDQPVRDFPTGLFFKNVDAVIADDTSSVLFRPDHKDDTIPKTVEAQQELVFNLVNAITNSADVKEKTTAKVFANRWAPGAQYYKPHAIEKLAWRIVQTAKDLHENGCIWPVYDDGLISTFKASEKFTFKGRTDIIIRLLKHSKRTCEDILKGEKFYTIIGAPHVLEARTTSNAVSNSRKAKRIAYATAAEKNKDPEVPGSSATDDNTPGKHTKKTTRAPRASKTDRKTATGSPSTALSATDIEAPLKEQKEQVHAANTNDQVPLSPEQLDTPDSFEQAATKRNLSINTDSDDEPSPEELRAFEMMNSLCKPPLKAGDTNMDAGTSFEPTQDDTSSNSSRKRSRTDDDEYESRVERKRSRSSSA